MIVLSLLPTGVSLLVLAAHFLRDGNLILTAFSVTLLGIMVVRHPWARRVLQIAMVLGMLEWLETLLAIVGQRIGLGEPWIRLALILGAVAAIAGLATLMLESSRPKRWFRQEVPS